MQVCEKLNHRINRARKLKLKNLKSMINTGDYHISSVTLAAALIFGR